MTHVTLSDRRQYPGFSLFRDAHHVEHVGRSVARQHVLHHVVRVDVGGRDVELGGGLLRDRRLDVRVVVVVG